MPLIEEINESGSSSNQSSAEKTAYSCYFEVQLNETAV